MQDQYIVKQQGKVLKSFNFFFEAWLFAYLETSCYCFVSGPEGMWIVNPGKLSIN